MKRDMHILLILIMKLSKRIRSVLIFFRKAHHGFSRERVDHISNLLHRQPPFAEVFILLYHEAKMFACKDIFAKPSMVHPRIARAGVKPQDLQRKALCIHYTIYAERNQYSKYEYCPHNFKVVSKNYRERRKSYVEQQMGIRKPSVSEGTL